MVQYGGGLQWQAAAPLAGFTLVNGTPNIIAGQRPMTGRCTASRCSQR